MTRVTTWGLPTVSSKPSRFIISTKIASWSSPRPCTSHVSGRSVGSTRIETLPIVSSRKRSFTMLAVNLVPPLRPATGDVLIPIVMEIEGSSTVITGKAMEFSGSANVSPIVMSGKPATAMMSPGPALSAGTRLNASVMRSSTTFMRVDVPSACIQATCWPLVIVP